MLIARAYAPVRVTRQAAQLHSRALDEVRCRTEQGSRSFVPRVIKAWNLLPEIVFEDCFISSFKTRTNAFFIGITIYHFFLFSMV